MLNKPGRKLFLSLIVLTVVGSFLYYFNLQNGLFWDDNDWIVNNTYVHSLSWDNIKFWLSNNTLAGVGQKSNYYRPFLFFTFALNYTMGEISPVGYHLLSNFLHIANGILIFFLLNILLNKSTRGFSPVSFLASLIFIIHPLQTEAVSYIAGRGDTLTVFFMLLALLVFIRSQLSDFAKNSIWGKILPVLFLIFALLSRETAIIFPLLAFLAYFSFVHTGKFWEGAKKSFLKTLPYFAVVVLYGILRLTALNFSNTLNFYSTSNIYSENLHVRLFTFSHALLDYFKLLFVPTGLHMERSVPIHLSFFQWPVWLGAIIVAGIIYTGYRFYRLEIKNSKLEIQSNYDFRIWLFGWGWFFIALAPVSGITPINAQIYEHWLYLPMVGVWFIAAFYLVKLFKFLNYKLQITNSEQPAPRAENLKSQNTNLNYLKFGNRTLFKIWKSAFVILLAVYFGFFSCQSIQRNILWGKPIEFYGDILNYEPDSVRINNNLGNEYYNSGDVEKAEFYYRKAIESEDIFPQPHYNIATILQKRGDIFGAIQEYKKAIEINPMFYYPYQNLAAIYVERGEFDSALEVLEQMRSVRPNDPILEYGLALVYANKGDDGEALSYIRRGLALAPPGSKVQAALNDLLKIVDK